MFRTKSDHGWAWIILLASFLEHAIMGYCQYASGIIYIALLENFHESILTTTWVIALFLALVAFAGPIASILINRFNCRVAMISGSLMLTTGLVMTAFVTEIKWTFLTFGVLAGSGIGICYNTGIIVLAFNFEKRRNLACGIAVSGAGIGPFILTPIFQMIYETYSYTGYFLLLGGLALQNCVFGVLFRESELEVEMRRANKNRKQDFKNSLKSYMKIVRSTPMFCICVCFFLADISIFLVYIHFPEYCLHTFSSKRDVSLFVSLAGISSCVARILYGMANNSRNIDELTMLFGVFSLLGLATILFPMFSYSFHGKMIYACILGGYSGCCWTVVNSIVIQILGPEKLAHAVGYLMVYVGIGTFLGPPLAGFIIDYGGTYRDSFIAAGILLIVGAFCSLLSVIFRTEKPEKETYLENYEFNVKVDEKEGMMLKVDDNDVNHIRTALNNKTEK